MSVFIDRNFLLQLSPKLQKFSRKKDDLYNFRCPLCGDSQKNKNKCRGYVYRKNNDYFFMCHNCHASTSFYNFLKQVDPNLLEEYSLERYKNSANTNSPEPTFTEAKVKPVFTKKLDLPSIASLPDDHFAKVYVVGRMIPEEMHQHLYFAEDYKSFVESFNIEKDKLKEDDPRLVIPFYDKDGTLTGFQGRALGESKLRYITIRLWDDAPKAFGMNKVNEDEKVYVVEGVTTFTTISVALSATNANLFRSASIILTNGTGLTTPMYPRALYAASSEPLTVLLPSVCSAML